MDRIPRQFYTQEFKEEAASLVEKGGLTVAEASRRLSVSEQTLRNWIKKYRLNGKVSSGDRAVTDLEAENSRLRKELVEARLEKEILKKAMVGSTGRCNTLKSSDLKGGAYGANGKTRSFCHREDRTVEALERRANAERNWSRP